MNKNRPVNLDLLTIRQPLPAIASILHRISGVFLLIGIGVLIWLFNLSLQSADGFERAVAFAQGGFASFILWLVLAAVAYHLVAGIKHLFMDAGFGETKEGGLANAIIVLVAAALLIILAAIWVWA